MSVRRGHGTARSDQLGCRILTEVAGLANTSEPPDMNYTHLTPDSLPPIFQFASSPAVLGAAIGALSRERALYFEPTLQGLVLLRREDVLAALRDPARYSNRCYGTGPLIWSPISMDGAQHMRVRRPYGPFFSPAAAQRYEESVVLPVVRELVASLTPADDSGSGRGPGLDLLSDFAAHIPLRVLTRLFGLPTDAYSVPANKAAKPANGGA